MTVIKGLSKNWRTFRRSAGKGVGGAMPCVNLSGLGKHPHSKGAFSFIALQPEILDDDVVVVVE